jgi:hypothetical protein
MTAAEAGPTRKRSDGQRAGAVQTGIEAERTSRKVEGGSEAQAAYQLLEVRPGTLPVPLDSRLHDQHGGRGAEQEKQEI